MIYVKNITNATGSSDTGTYDTSYDEDCEYTHIVYCACHETIEADEAEIIVSPHNYRHSQTQKKQEHIYALLISLIFNIYRQQYISKRMFSKSGFCGRVAKRRKGRK